MPGALDQLTRKLVKTVIPVWMGDIDNVDITPGSDVTAFSVPFTCQVKGLTVQVPGGTASSQLILEVFRGGGVGVGSAIISAPSVAVATGGATTCVTNLNVYLEECETLYLVARGSDADTDDFTDVQFMLIVQPVVDENAA